MTATDKVEADAPARDGDDHRVRAPSRTLVTTSTIPRSVLYPPRSSVRRSKPKPGQWKPGNSS